jgi:Zn-dependent protease
MMSVPPALALGVLAATFMAQATNVVAWVVGLAMGIYSIILHEIGHAAAADRLGDPTARLAGRLTLNPIVHIDPLSTFLIPLFTYVASQGSFILGGARPVPVNPSALRGGPKARVLVSLAGPAVNLTLAILCALLCRLLSFGSGFVNARIIQIVYAAGWLNVLLLVFNMIPIPPLDGSRVLRHFLPPDSQRALDQLEQFGLMFVMLFLILFRPWLNYIFTPFLMAYDFIAR